MQAPEKLEHSTPTRPASALAVLALRVTLLLSACVLPLVAGEKNGVTPNTVSLPSGPGTIEGLGDSFEPMLQTGTAGHGLPLAGAGVGLSYDGGFGNGPAGYGWKFEPTSIARQIERGIPRYEEPARDDTYLGGAGMELVELKNGHFFPRTGGGFTRHERIESATPGVFHWQARGRDGSLAVFGESAAARVSLPEGESPDGKERIFRWHIERQTDIHGNTVLYEWSDLGRPGDRRKYLRAIRSGPGAPPWSVQRLAVFEYEERPDSFVDCRAGFAVRTSFRLKTVKVGLHGAPRETTEPCRVEDLDGDGDDDVLVRRYEILYEGHRHWSLLTQVTLVGCDGVSSLPPASYRYGTTDDRLDEEREFIARDEHLIFSENAPSLVTDAGDVELCDLNSDGLPDLVHTLSGTHRGYLNQGVVIDGGAGDASCPTGICRIEWSAAVEPGSQVPALEHRLSDPRVHLADMDADGRSDLVVTESDLVKYFPNRGKLVAAVNGSAVWGEARRMSIDGEAPPPPFVFESEERITSVKTLDLDFDRRIDVVRSSPAGYTVWYNRGGDVYSPATRTCGAVIDGEVLEFRDRRVKLADLNGDGPVDVARIEPTRVVYCPSHGHGKYGAQVELAFPEVVLEPFQHERAELKDVNGDGLADLVVERAREYELWFWLNLGPVGLSARRVVRDLHDVAGDVEVDWADMNGSGTTDVVYTDSRLCPGLRVRVIDLGLIVDGSSHPRLLKTIDNGLGLRTEIGYRTSSEYYQEARAAGNPWTTSNPKSVRVVAHTETTTGSDLDGVPGVDVHRTDYLYRDGYYDDVRRQFTGFGFVKAIARGDEREGLAAADVSGPSVVTRTRFHVGGPDGVDNDRDGETDEYEEWMGREEEPLKGMVLWSETASLPAGAPLVGSFVDASDGSHAPDSRVFSRSVTPLSEIEIREVCRVSLSPLAALLGDASYDAASPGRRVVITTTHRAEAWTIEQGRGPPRLVCAESDVNALGDPLWAHALGEIDPVTGSPLGDTRYTETEYTHKLDAWLLGVPVRARARAGGASGRFVSEARSYYDGDAFVGLPFGQVGAKALVHRVESFINEPPDWTPPGGTLPPLEVDSPRVGDPRLGVGDEISVNAARTRYDQYGNVVETRGPLHRDGLPGHRSEVNYDPYLHAFPIAERIDTGGPALSVTASYQLALGLVTSSVDFNGREMLYQHDVFGRPTALVAPWDSEAFPSAVFRYRQANPRPLIGTRPRPGDAPLATSTPLFYEYDGAGALTLTSGASVPRVSSVRTSTRERAGEAATIDAIAHVDGGGTALAALSESITPGRWVVSGAAWYNLRGQPRCGFQPYEQEGSAYTPPVEGLKRSPDSPDTPGELVQHGDIYYDALGRSIRAVTPPDENGLRHESRTVHRPFAVDAWDGEDTIEGGRHAGTYSTTIVDGLGRTSEVIERNRLETDPDDDATEYVTRYEYNDADALRAVIDAQNNRKHQRQDALGRRIFLDDLHAGHHFSTYDAAGQLVDMTDARGQRTVFRYDGAGRALEVNYLDRTGDPATDPWDVRYRYDVPEGLVDMGDGTVELQQNLLGAMASLEWRIPNLVDHGDTFGKSWSSLDERGRVAWSATRIPDPVTGLDVYYSTHSVYDHQNRVIESTYPDGDRVTYEYDRLSRVTSVRGSNAGREIIRSVDYHPAGHLRGMVHGNGVRSTLTHDPRLRVRESLTAGAGTSAGAELLHLDYRFGGAGNITRVRDLRPAVAASQARHDSRIFEYDDLYRLVRYQLSDVAGTANRGQIDYRHDRLGNLLYRGSPTAGSPGHIDHVEGGKDLVNIGAYTYGGGRSNRTGRAPGDPPGPQAVTATDSGRSYAYDRSGNMTDIDGKTATWDFADRLVRLEEDGGAEAGGKTVEYVYDADGERLVKKVTEDGHTSHVLYVGPGFEIRDGEEPTKYVFVGDKRVARVKGTLDPTAPRIQRLRLVEGWNMLCLAVELPQETPAAVFGLGTDPAVTSILTTTDGVNFIPIDDPSTPLERGRPYWVLSTAARMLTHVGSYAPPTAPIVLSADRDVIGWPRLEALRVEESFSGLLQAWSFDAESSAWLVKDFDPTSPVTNLTAPVPGGLGLWTFGDDMAPATERRFNPEATSAQDVLFYHSDHLGSSALVTDLDGRVVEETVYYPFGVPRLEERHTSWFEGDYKFTGKEHDKESGLYYYSARYYEPVVGRFISADPLYVGRFGGAGLGLGVYAYVMNNPVMFTDPTGLDCDPTIMSCPGAYGAGGDSAQSGRRRRRQRPATPVATAPLPAMSAPSTALLVVAQPGFVMQQHMAARREANNPDNSWLVRGIASALSTLTMPLGHAEEMARQVLNSGNTIINASTRTGERLARASILADRGETGDAVVEVLYSISDASEAFTAAVAVAVPVAGAGQAAATRGAARLQVPRVRPAPGCFTAGTRVLTPTGSRAIDKLEPGDLVLARDHEAQGENGVHPDERPAGELERILAADAAPRAPPPARETRIALGSRVRRSAATLLVAVLPGLAAADEVPTLDATTAVERFLPRTGEFEPARLADLRPGDELRIDAQFHRVSADGGVWLHPEITPAALALAHHPYEPGAAPALTSDAVVWQIDSDSGGSGSSHRLVSELPTGARFIHQGRRYHVEEHDGQRAAVDTGLIVSRVLSTFVRPDRAVWDLTLRDANGHEQTLTGTPDHPVYVPALDAYVPLEDLRAGWAVRGADGPAVDVLGVSDADRRADTYDFEVAGVHNYLVAEGDGDVGVGVHNSAPKSTLAANKAQGAAFEQKVKQDLLQIQSDVVEQITVKTQSGTRTRLDLVGHDKTTGGIRLTEAKSSATAPLTKNQRKAFPEIEQSGGTVVGKGKPPFVGGTQIPPTKVDIVRP